MEVAAGAFWFSKRSADLSKRSVDFSKRTLDKDNDGVADDLARHARNGAQVVETVFGPERFAQYDDNRSGTCADDVGRRAYQAGQVFDAMFGVGNSSSSSGPALAYTTQPAAMPAAVQSAVRPPMVQQYPAPMQPAAMQLQQGVMQQGAMQQMQQGATQQGAMQQVATQQVATQQGAMQQGAMQQSAMQQSAMQQSAMQQGAMLAAMQPTQVTQVTLAVQVPSAPPAVTASHCQTAVVQPIGNFVPMAQMPRSAMAAPVTGSRYT